MAKTVKRSMKKETVKVAPVVAKAAEVKEEVKAEPVVEAVAEVKEEVKAEPVVETVAEVKEEVKKAPAKKAAAKKTAEKEEVPAKKATTKKAAVKASVTLQFADKSYTEETLVSIAKDVWKYDLNQQEADLKTVELYVKPEEGLCYYVFNADVTGSFVI